jgi:hypothetical protein
MLDALWVHWAGEYILFKADLLFPVTSPIMYHLKQDGMKVPHRLVHKERADFHNKHRLFT